jgi:hypothetical protein
MLGGTLGLAPSTLIKTTGTIRRIAHGRSVQGQQLSVYRWTKKEGETDQGNGKAALQHVGRLLVLVLLLHPELNEWHRLHVKQ